MTLNDLFQLAPYSLGASQKERALSEILSDLTHWHYANCPEYARILNALSFDASKIIPVQSFLLFPSGCLKSLNYDPFLKNKSQRH